MSKNNWLFGELSLSYETILRLCNKFFGYFKDIIKKKEKKPTDKWHLDEMTLKINANIFILWRAVDSEGHELDVFLQKRYNKKAAIWFDAEQQVFSI